MGLTYNHTANTFIADQSFINDVGIVLRDRLQWDGSSLTPNTVNDIIFTKDQGHGIKVDPSNASFGWQDLLSPVTIDIGAANNKPSFAIYTGGIKQYQFIQNDQVWSEYHIPHDYAPNTIIYIHTHWSHPSAGLTGNVVWGFEATYSKGHNQQSFSNTVTTTVTAPASNIALRHLLSETALSGVGLLVTGDIEPDGIILLRTFLSQNNLSPASNPFLHFVDIHYQSTGIGTKQRIPNFYN
jgi:hypothetical protein